MRGPFEPTFRPKKIRSQFKPRFQKVPTDAKRGVYLFLVIGSQEIGEQFFRICFHCEHKFDEFHDVNASLPILILGDKGLRAPNLRGEVVLR